MWTFERLAQASRATLEKVLVHSKAPRRQRLAGTVYKGYNHDWLGQLPGKKFRKVFFQRDGAYYGLNQVVIQDGNDFTGEWRLKMEKGAAVERGYFSVVPAAELHPQASLGRYRHLLRFDYDTDPNPRWNFLMRSIQDFVGLPNEEDYSVLLGKAYLRILPDAYVFASYFVLEQLEANASGILLA